MTPEQHRAQAKEPRKASGLEWLAKEHERAAAMIETRQARADSNRRLKMNDASRFRASPFLMTPDQIRARSAQLCASADRETQQLGRLGYLLARAKGRRALLRSGLFDNSFLTAKRLGALIHFTLGAKNSPANLGLDRIFAVVAAFSRDVDLL